MRLLLVFVLLFLVSGCISSSPKETTTTLKSTTSTLITTTSSDKLVNCEKIQDSLPKRQCYMDVAIELKDTSICDKIQDPDINALRLLCYSKIALVENNSKICELLDNSNSYRDSCFRYLGEKLGNIIYCNQISDYLSRSMCIDNLAELYQDIKYCYVGDYLSGICVSGVATKKDDTSLCYKVDDPVGKDQCFSILASRLRNPDICKLISEKSGRISCEEGLIGFSRSKYNFSINGRPTYPANGDKKIIVFYSPSWLNPILKEFDIQTLEINSIQLVFKSYDLSFMEPMSKDVDIAILCSYRQNKFIEFSNALNGWGQTHWRENPSEKDILSLANEVDISKDKFLECIESNESETLINQDRKEAVDAGINGVPAFIVNDRVFSGLAKKDEVIAETKK